MTELQYAKLSSTVRVRYIKLLTDLKIGHYGRQTDLGRARYNKGGKVPPAVRGSESAERRRKADPSSCCKRRNARSG
jgi:hypothetical protein